MKSLYKITTSLCMILSLLSSDIQAVNTNNRSITIRITGRIEKFINITSSKTNAELDLEANYSRNTGTLTGAAYNVSDIDVRSNSKDGYKIKVTTANQFELKNASGVKISYTLELRNADDTPDNSTINPVRTNNGTMLSALTAGNFRGNSLVNAELTVITEDTEDFLIDDEVFEDSVTLTVVAN
jgi:hypothetical protein